MGWGWKDKEPPRLVALEHVINGTHPHCVFLNRSPNRSDLAVFIPLVLVGEEWVKGATISFPQPRDDPQGVLIQQTSKKPSG